MSPFDEMGTGMDYDVLRLMDKAEDLVKNKCLKDKGFPESHNENYYPDDLPESGFESMYESDTPEGIWGDGDVERAKKYGFVSPMIVSEELGQWGWDWEAEKYVEMNEEYYREKWGPPSDETYEDLTESEKANSDAISECGELGNDKLYEGLDVEGAKSRSAELAQIQASATEAAKVDPRMLEREKIDSECMDRNGYPVGKRTPEELGIPFDTEKEILWDKAYKSAQIALATAMATCIKEANYAEIWYDILYEKQREVIQENLPLFEAEKAYHNSLVKRAEDIIKEHG
jgi:hypothetical protein